jgi:hypothetical protein
MFTSTRPSSHRYQVAADTGRPSRRKVVMTAGFGLRSIAIAAAGSGGFDMRTSEMSCGDVSRWHAARTLAGQPDGAPGQRRRWGRGRRAGPERGQQSVILARNPH